LAPTAVIGFGPDLFRVTRDLFFGEGNAFFSPAVVTAVPVLGCQHRGDAAEPERRLNPDSSLCH